MRSHARIWINESRNKHQIGSTQLPRIQVPPRKIPVSYTFDFASQQPGFQDGVGRSNLYESQLPTKSGRKSGENPPDMHATLQIPPTVALVLKGKIQGQNLTKKEAQGNSDFFRKTSNNKPTPIATSSVVGILTYIRNFSYIYPQDLMYGLDFKGKIHRHSYTIHPMDLSNFCSPAP